MRFPFLNRDKKKKKSAQEKAIINAIELIEAHAIFGNLPNIVELIKDKRTDYYAGVNREGRILLNVSATLNADEWAYVIAHCALHNAFGHFDKEKLPDDPYFEKHLWNQVCDIYITRYLLEMKFGQAIAEVPTDYFPRWVVTEIEMYKYLKVRREDVPMIHCGTSSFGLMDMDGLDKPVEYPNGNKNYFQEMYKASIRWGMQSAVGMQDMYRNLSQKKSDVRMAANWFIDHYPLLGGLAASFQLIEDNSYCVDHQIQVAAINIEKREIYVNPVMRLTESEWRFVLAHEYLHAGLCHAQRCKGRDFLIWNVACDLVINDWLMEMQIGTAPALGFLYDESLHGLSAETIYDSLIKNIRRNRKFVSFRGYGFGDMIYPEGQYDQDYSSFDDAMREALSQGLEYHREKGRGLLPAGLIEEIRALSMPPVPWDVKLAYWFQEHFPIAEKTISYAHLSRRQGATPDIPRPRYVRKENTEDNRTFGVILDTSGSMNVELLGKALGSIASYAEARDVKYIRVVFCDAVAYDAGYMTVEELAGKVEVKGRGGTRLQPAIDLLEEAKDFPKDGPILIITDGYIEPNVSLHRPHAWLLPKGNRLPFQTKAEVFYYSN